MPTVFPCPHCGMQTVVADMFDPPGGRLFSYGPNGVRVWEPLLQYMGHSDLIFQLACSPDGSHLASVGRDGSLKLWPVRLSNDNESGEK